MNGTFHLSPNENICSIAQMENIHYLLYITLQRFIFLNDLKEKSIENDCTEAKTYTQAKRLTQCGKYYAGGCITLNHALRLLRFPRVE